MQLKEPQRAELPGAPRLILPLLAFSVFWSAALLFLMQPMFGKMILPVFGGAPAVWITSLVFFQLMLLAGYLYVHASLMWLAPRKQAVLHAALMLVPLALLPVQVLTGWGLTSAFHPISSVFLVLLSSVGLPFFVVSTTAPLLQRWFGSSSHRLARDPFFLYAASNLGSIGALLLYPIVVEPRLHLDTQARVWSIAYGLLVVLTLSCALAIWKSLPANAKPAESAEDAPPIPWRTRLRWVALAAVPSSLLLSVTSHITADIAPIPLLWVIPLTIYLTTFVLAFSPQTVSLRRVASLGLPFVAVIVLAIVVSRMQEPPGFMLFHLAVLFLAAMTCHGELAASRPEIHRLTEFYVWLAVGGAVGGLFNVIIAPFVFRTEIEYPICIILACALRPMLGQQPSGSRVPITSVALALGLGVLVLAAEFVTEIFGVPHGSVASVVYVFALPAAIALILSRRPVTLALGLAAISFAATFYPEPNQSLVATERSFYGVHRIVNRGSYRILQNGNTHHGSQSLRPPRRCVPLSYYYPTGPLGELFATFTGGRARSNVGIIGLGTGSTGGYAQPGQRWTFYEIDPAIERIARNPRYFTFLRDCVPQAKVVIGDARLSLTKQPDRVHDLIVIDAFSSDAIPIHLLTHEAMDIYVHKLAEHGVLAFHISNRYVNLRRVLGRLARDANLVAFVREDQSVTPLEAYDGKVPSVWVMMARLDADLGPLSVNPGWLKFPADVTGLSWTDNYSNVLETLKLHL